MSNVLNVVRQNLLSINQLKQNYQSSDSRLKSLEEQVNILTELLNSLQKPIAKQPVVESPADEEPVVESPADEEPVTEEGNLNLEVQ